MSQSHYHVFLPPSLSSLSPPIPRISFQDLVVSREVESQLEFGHASQVSRIKRISQSQSGPSQQNDQKGKVKEDPSPEYADGTSTQYSWPPTPLEFIGSGSSSKKRMVDDGNTSTRGNTIKKSRAPLTLSGSTTHTTEDQHQDLSVDVSGSGMGSGIRRKSSRVRRSGSGMSLRIFLHLIALLSGNPKPFNSHAMFDLQRSMLIIGLLGTFPDQETQDESFLSLDTTISSLPPSGEVSSVLNLPKWSIPLTKLSSLPTLLQSHKEPHTISVIVCILSVDTPILRQRKEEKRRGQDGSLWIGGWVVTAPNIWVGYAPQGDGGGCGVKLWGDAAREWGDEVVRKGDVVLLESRSSLSGATSYQPIGPCYRHRIMAQSFR
jgi:hypothetical protein